MPRHWLIDPDEGLTGVPEIDPDTSDGEPEGEPADAGDHPGHIEAPGTA